MNAFTFPPPPPSTEAEALRAEVRDFLSQQLAPSFSLCGDTRKILRDIIARGLGLR